MTRRTTAGAVIVGLAMCAVLSACTSAGSTTCSELAAQDSSAQNSTLSSLLREHDLDPYAVNNVVGLQTAVSGFCGLTLIPGFEEEPSQNADQPIADAVDWESETW
jgi:hypothetical protein